jgi:hypothetical protein
MDSIKVMPEFTAATDTMKGDVQSRIEDRMKRVKSAYHARGAKLAQAWSLTNEALTS